MRYLEFCAGIGGTRAGLEFAGWESCLSIDNDSTAVQIHNLAYGENSAIELDIRAMSLEDLPEVDAFVAGFPCQPFSTAGNRLGFEHETGNVFDHIIRLAGDDPPPLMVLENVEGLFNNKSGHTLSMILKRLNALGYIVDWLLLNLSWFGCPQTRPRVFIVAAQTGVLMPDLLTNSRQGLFNADEGVRSVFSSLIERLGIICNQRTTGSLDELELLLRPSIGKKRPLGMLPFGKLGHAENGEYLTFDLKVPKHSVNRTLASIVAPNFPHPEVISSVRFYARGGPSTLYLRKDPISHCVGSSIGGAPLYAIPTKAIGSANDSAAFLEYSNWHRTQDDYLVMRLRPDYAVKLFGPYTDNLFGAVSTWNGTQTKKYQLVGNMVAPVCAYEVANAVNQSLLTKGYRSYSLS